MVTRLGTCTGCGNEGPTEVGARGATALPSLPRSLCVSSRDVGEDGVQCSQPVAGKEAEVRARSLKAHPGVPALPPSHHPRPCTQPPQRPSAPPPGPRPHRRTAGRPPAPCEAPGDRTPSHPSRAQLCVLQQWMLKKHLLNILASKRNVSIDFGAWPRSKTPGHTGQLSLGSSSAEDTGRGADH